MLLFGYDRGLLCNVKPLISFLPPLLLLVPRLYAWSLHNWQDMSEEALAAMGYKGETLAMGNENVQHLLAVLVADPARAGLLYDTTSGGADVTLATRTSVKFFADSLGGQAVDRLVRITNTFGAQTEYCHLVALGPDGFFLCTCLRLLVHGLGCRHALRAMREADLGFNGACIAPRWRDRGMPWTMGPLAAKPAAVATTGVPGALLPAPANLGVFSHSKSTVRANVWASCTAFAKELAPLTTGIDTIPGIQRVLENLKIHARQLIEVEVRAQHDASASRVFKGVAARPTTATGPPQGGNGGTGLGGGRGSGNGGGRGRGGARGRRGRGSAGRGGRGGAVSGVSATGIPSPGVGLLAAQQEAGAGVTGGGGVVGGAVPGFPATGMPSPGVGVTPTNGTHAVGGSGTPLGSLSNAPPGGVGQASLGLATNCCAPETFQQSTLNGEAFRATANHGQPLCPTPPDIAFLDQVQSPARQRHQGQTKRRTGTAQRNKRGGGQHVVQGGANGAWGI